MGDGEKLLTHLNSSLKVLLVLDIFPRVPKKKLNFVDQCYRCHFNVLLLWVLKVIGSLMSPKCNAEHVTKMFNAVYSQLGVNELVGLWFINLLFFKFIIVL